MGSIIHTTPVAPHGPLGLVIWIDNQYAALPPTGGLRFGTLANLQPAWLEIEQLEVGSEHDGIPEAAYAHS